MSELEKQGTFEDIVGILNRRDNVSIFLLFNKEGNELYLGDVKYANHNSNFMDITYDGLIKKTTIEVSAKDYEITYNDYSKYIILKHKSGLYDYYINWRWGQK